MSICTGNKANFRGGGEIFVTVGSTKVDELIKQMDSLAKTSFGGVLCQIGNSDYVPKHCEYFRFAEDLTPYIDQARVIVSHTGAGTIFECLTKEKVLITVPNPNHVDNHDLAIKMAKENYSIHCEDMSLLKMCILAALLSTVKEEIKCQLKKQ